MLAYYLHTLSPFIWEITPARVDVTAWTPSRQWDLVTANLFSDLLVKVSPKIVHAVKPGGHLILSGMLTPQASETLAAFKSEGVEFQRVMKRGKWTSALGARATRSPLRPARAPACT